MDSTSPIAPGIAGQPSADFGTPFKPFFGMGFRTLVENCFVGRRWLSGRQQDDGRRRDREQHYRLADGHGRAS